MYFSAAVGNRQVPDPMFPKLYVKKSDKRVSRGFHLGVRKRMAKSSLIRETITIILSERI